MRFSKINLTLVSIGILLYLLCISAIAKAQVHQITVKGKVTAIENDRPLPDAIVQVDGAGIFATTDQNGFFTLLLRNPGAYQLLVSLLGKKQLQLNILLKKDTLLNLQMETLSLALKEVSVVSKRRKMGSSNVIDQTAIHHLQPISLGDILQLLPGQLARNPDMSAAQQFNLRQVPSNSDASRANALGTAIIMDGIPLSNNANLQTSVNILNSAPGSLPSFSSVAGRGNDLRQIPADQIESIEVITGVPSARYGDLTSGGVLVNTRAGVFSPQLTTRVNPLLVQQSLGFGFKLGKNGGILSIDNDFSYSFQDPRNTLSQYTRITNQLTYSKAFLKNKGLYTTTRLGFSSTLDNLKQDPDDKRYQRKIYSKDQGLRFGTNLKLNTSLSWLSSLTMDFGINYTHQQSYLQELITRDLFPVSNALVDGTNVARYGESEYLSVVNTDGKPLSLYNRLEGVFFNNATARNLKHQLVAGFEYRFDGNTGEGRLFDPTRPPRQNYAVGDRPRSYDEIPALQQIGYYVEDRITSTIFNRELNFNAGIRYDNIQPSSLFTGRFGNKLLPRINMAVEIWKNFRFKAGYGLTSKSPTLSFLYPGKRYVDLVNFNYYAANPTERLVVITTKVFDVNNEQLKSYTAEKFELGLDYEKNGFSGYITAYREGTNGAFGINRDVTVLAVAKLKATSFPVGTPPVLSPTPESMVPFYAGYDVSVNNRKITNKGVEFQLNTPEFKDINTSLNFNGAWTTTTSFDNGNAVDYQKAIFSSVTPTSVAIYRSGFGNRGSRFNTSLRFATHFPQLKFLLSGLVQTVWSSSNRNLDLSPYPVGYVSNMGEVVYLSQSDAMKPEYIPLRRILSSTLAGTDSAPPLWLFNIRLTKEFKNNSGISFYVNNVVADRGTYLNTVSNSFVQRNQSLFFGAEFTIHL
ncbi:hypothetical protein ACVWYN_002810 [Pedobacter sp. UYP24]